VRNSCGVGVHEGASLFQEIIEFTLFVSGSRLSVSESSGCSGGTKQNFSDTIKRNLLSRG